MRAYCLGMQTFGKRSYDNIELDPWKRPVAVRAPERRPVPTLKLVIYAVSILAIGAVLYSRVGPFISA